MVVTSPGDLVDEATAVVVNSISPHVNLSAAHRRLQIIARVLICATFFEDALRMATDFKAQTATIFMVASAGKLPIPPEEAWAVVVCSALVQGGAASAVTFHTRELAGCVTLICWSAVHPVLYAQLSNTEFIAETMTVIGGLCILLSHLNEMRAARANLMPDAPILLPDAPVSDRLCLIGRVLLTTYFVYYALWKMREAVCGRMATHQAVIEGILVVGLAYVCMLVVIGRKSRRIALGLAVVMMVSNFVFHPFWFFWMVGHKYVDVADLDSLRTRLPVDLSQLGNHPEVTAVLGVYDHEQYFFFQRLSTVGALILLAVYGPGRHSVDEPKAPPKMERFTTKGRD